MDRKNRKGESGTQLLARLSTRIDLSSLDPDVFCSSSVSASSSACKPPSSGKIIELYGTEGVGKTELALHYVAKACLPSQWKRYNLNGLGAKVIIIDTEFKFSVLRLAIVLEKQISSILEKLRESNVKESTVKDATSKNAHVRSDLKMKDMSVQKDRVMTKICTHFTDTSEQDTMDKVSITMQGKDSAPKLVDEKVDGLGLQMKSANPSIEDLVQDTLSRVQVLRVCSTEQLLISLISLESTLSCDPLVSLVVIDTISAFYWSDKLANLDNTKYTESKMSPVVSVISKYMNEFGLSFLVTKSALMDYKGGKGKSFKRYPDKSDTYQGSSSQMTRKERTFCDPVEFLGRSWASVSVKRIVITRRNSANGQDERSARCSDWPSSKSFTFVDDGLQFL